MQKTKRRSGERTLLRRLVTGLSRALVRLLLNHAPTVVFDRREFWWKNYSVNEVYHTIAGGYIGLNHVGVVDGDTAIADANAD